MSYEFDGKVMCKITCGVCSSTDTYTVQGIAGEFSEKRLGTLASWGTKKNSKGFMTNLCPECMRKLEKDLQETTENFLYVNTDD